MPVSVANTMVRPVNTSIFFVPITLRSTSILGRETAGPASKSASIGPGAMPSLPSASQIGISVNVAKYINAPVNEAKKLVQTGQTTESLAGDIMFFKATDIDMIGLGPYIPHRLTPLAARAMAKKAISVWRQGRMRILLVEDDAEVAKGGR